MSSRITACLAFTLLACVAQPAAAGLTNGGFETSTPDVPPGTFAFIPESGVPGWQTTASDNIIEIWGSGFFVPGVDAFPFVAFEGENFAELNATDISTLFQEVSGIGAGSIVGFQFAHRGRGGVDTMRLTITDLGGDALFGSPDDTTLFTKLYSDGNRTWGFYTNAGEPPIVTLGNPVRFAYEAVSSAFGLGAGNFLDDVDFGVGVGASPAAVPEPGSLTVFSAMLLTAAGISWRRRRPA